VMPPPGVVLEVLGRYAERVGHRVQLVAGVGQQVAELGETQPAAGV